MRYSLQPKRSPRIRRWRVWFSPYLLAVALAPAFVQIDYSGCAYYGNSGLSEFELIVDGENRLVGFDPDLRSYSASLPSGTWEARVRTVAQDDEASVSIFVLPEGESLTVYGERETYLDIGVGGSDYVVPLPPGSAVLQVWVAPHGGATDYYEVNLDIAGFLFPCTEQGIRDAIAFGGGPHTFDCDGPTVVPTEDEIVIDNDVILDGEGNLIVDANQTHRVFSIPEGVTAGLMGFRLEGGANVEEGGGILNAGVLTLTTSTVTANAALRGGGILNLEAGSLTVERSAVSMNTANEFGGGIQNLGQAAMVDSEVSRNTAGIAAAAISTGFDQPDAVMTLTRSRIQDNVALGGVGAITNYATLELVDSTVSGNAGPRTGGIGNRGNLTLTRTNISSNTSEGDGGGILNEAVLLVTDSSISGNAANNQGGGVYNEGIMTLTDGNVSGNHVGEYGGGIFSVGSLEVRGSTISGNTAIAGGGIENAFPGTLSVADSTVSNNTATRFGGGIYNHNDAFAQVVGTTISNNIAMVSAGGISNRPGATMSVTSSDLRGNTAEAGSGGGVQNAGTLTMSGVQLSLNTAATDGGGIFNTATLTLSNSTVSGNSAPQREGGGIVNDGNGMLVVEDTAISDNWAGGDVYGSGGGILNFAHAELRNCELSRNVANAWGGGIATLGTLIMTNTTVSGNADQEGGGGIGTSGDTTVISSTIARNQTGISIPAGPLTLSNTLVENGCGGATPNSRGHNIESPSNTCGFDQPTDLVNVPATALNLGPLADNGGPTRTHALLPGSVAIDWVATEACVNAAGFPLLVDQRGAPRPYGPACDSGSFELGAVPLPRDLCTNDADRAAYESLNYINGGGIPSTCIDAATAIAADCVFGSAQSSPPIAGCPTEVAAVIACYPNCSPDVIAAFNQCLTTCTAGASGLSTECAGCYGDWAGCGAQVCVPECAGGVGSPSCTDCLSASGCTGLFNACTGLPGDIDCGGTGGVDYAQDFESLDQSSPTALRDDGWIVFGAVFTPDDETFLYSYFFPAPNNIGGFCGITSGQGGPAQGDQQLLIISDYNNVDAQIAGNRVEASTYRERPITAEDVGKTVVFSFDGRRGNINDPDDPGCIESASPTCDSTADAFIHTVDPDAGFALTNVVEVDTTALSENWGRYSVSFTINPELVGQLLQVGFSATASNFEPSGVFYDNIVVVLEAP